MSLSIDVSEYDIADGIRRGDLSAAAIVRCLAGDMGGEEDALLVAFDDIGEVLKSARLAPAVREFGEELSCIAVRFHQKLLKEDQS